MSKLGGAHQGLRIRGFRAEAQCITKGRQSPDTSGSEALRRGQGGIHRKLQHQVRSAAQCCLCPEGLVDDGGHSPLNEAAAHGADDGAVGSEPLTNGRKLLAVAQVQGVVFANDTNCHGWKPSFFIKNFQMGLEKSGRIDYNMYKYDHGYHITKHRV